MRFGRTRTAVPVVRGYPHRTRSGHKVAGEGITLEIIAGAVRVRTWLCGCGAGASIV